MSTIAQLAKEMLHERMLIDEYLREGIINYVALAEKFQPRIEQEIGKKVKVTTIAMALRRLAEYSKKSQFNIPSLKNCELLMKNNLCDIAAHKSPATYKKLRKIYDLVDFNKGDTLNFVQGDYDVCVITNEKFKKRTLNMLEGEKVFHIESNLVGLTVKFGESLLYTPGVTYSVLKQLVLVNINLIEIISSLIETTFIINKKDATKGYQALQDFLSRK